MTEQKTVHRWFWVWDFEKEEQWLNAMAQSGWLLNRVGFSTYHFIACTPGEYAVRLEMHPCDNEYINFLGETGAEYIGRVVQWIYFRKRVMDGPFDLFSDLDSRLRHLSRISKTLACIGFANLAIGLANSVSGSGVGWINLLCAMVLMYALGRIHGKMESLEKQRLLVEG